MSDPLLERLRAAPAVALLLDYDGTLMPFAQTPDKARPDAELLELLRALAARPKLGVHIVSGRTRPSMEGFLGALPIALHAEHGLWSRAAGEREWIRLPGTSPAWLDDAFRIVDEIASRTPGSVVEKKSGGLSWHYRRAEPKLGEKHAEELRGRLRSALAGTGAEVFDGVKVVELRESGVHKGRVVEPIRAALPKGAVLVIMGDDVTDEDMLAAATSHDVRVRVGPREGASDLALADPAAARAWLRGLL